MDEKKTGIKRQKRRIRKIEKTFDDRESKEREELLREHRKKWLAKSERLYVICERYGGHEYRRIQPTHRNLSGKLGIICINCGHQTYNKN